MMKSDLKKWVCRPYCSFFREGEKEDLLCQGARGMAHLVKKGLVDPAGLPIFGKSAALKAIVDSDLIDIICHACPFQAADCDFQATPPSAVPPDSEPCGGYILLRLLMLNRYLEPSDLKALKNG